jgi:hypothetical protein
MGKPNDQTDAAADQLAAEQAAHAETRGKLADEQAAHADTKAQLEALTAPTPPWPPNRIITVSQLEALTDAQKQEFRRLNGTATNDPV